jgi:hypothetical protein
MHTLKTDKLFIYRLKKGDFDVCKTTFRHCQETFGWRNSPYLVRWIILILFDNLLFCQKGYLRRITFPIFFTYKFSAYDGS